MMPYTTIEEDRAFGSEFLTAILDWVANEYAPEDIFDSGSLADWAEENGWTEEA